MKRQIRLLVCSHKNITVPRDETYLPLQVGVKGKERFPNYASDAEGEHISEKNPEYCELTGLYWAWKNLQQNPDDYLGLVHYRRYFAKGGLLTNKQARIAQKADFEKILETTDVILPKQRHYYIETNYQQYVHAHHQADLDETRQILAERYPEYLTAYDVSMKRTHGHRFNMFVMKRSMVDSYCGWLFDVLNELETRLDISQYSVYDRRVYGFVGERLLDVWLETNHIAYYEMPYVFMEKQNWFVKGGRFLMRKLKGGKRDE